MKPAVKIKRTYQRGCNGGNRKDTKHGYAKAIRRESKRLTKTEQ